jgi:hypothetical protein
VSALPTFPPHLRLAKCCATCDHYFDKGQAHHCALLLGEYTEFLGPLLSSLQYGFEIAGDEIVLSAVSFGDVSPEQVCDCWQRDENQEDTPHA